MALGIADDRDAMLVPHFVVLTFALGQIERIAEPATSAPAHTDAQKERFGLARLASATWRTARFPVAFAIATARSCMARAFA